MRLDDEIQNELFSPENQKRLFDYLGVKYFMNKNGVFHNEDGPAVEFESGYAEYWIEGRVIKSYQEFQELTNHSDEYITYLKLKYGAIDV